MHYYESCGMMWDYRASPARAPHLARPTYRAPGAPLIHRAPTHRALQRRRAPYAKLARPSARTPLRPHAPSTARPPIVHPILRVPVPPNAHPTYCAPYPSRKHTANFMTGSPFSHYPLCALRPPFSPPPRLPPGANASDAPSQSTLSHASPRSPTLHDQDEKN
ncbi:hypothetical protein V8D89_005238 [Ganoderma adspersum]